MRITGRRVEEFLRRPDPGARCILVFGPDQGLVRERAKALAATVVEDLSDPFRVTEIPAAGLKAEPTLLADEAAALSFSGGRRVVWVRDAADPLASTFSGFLSDPMGEALVLAEAGDLSKGSKLRKLFEGADNAAAIPCYADEGRDLHQVVRDSLSKHDLKAGREVVDFLVERLGADRMVTRNEIDKLALYAGGPGEVTLEDARAAVGDNAAVSFDAVVLSAADANFAGLEKALARVWGEGLSPVAVIRAASRHFQRLHLVAAQVAQGTPADQAMKSLRPPVIFKVADRFRGQAHAWSPDLLARAIDLLLEAEMDCKTTGLPAEAICSQALLRIAQARARANRR